MVQLIVKSWKGLQMRRVRKSTLFFLSALYISPTSCRVFTSNLNLLISYHPVLRQGTSPTGIQHSPTRDIYLEILDEKKRGNHGI